jgi:hypothetical protein
LRLSAADGRDDALVDIGEQPGRGREEVQYTPQVDEVTGVGRQEDNQIIRVDGRAVLDLFGQGAEYSSTIRFTNECVEDLHYQDEQKGGQRVPLP